MNRQVRPSSRRRSRNRLRICAWIETSSEATGSSQTSMSGCIASARAIATRWRWPPENWCGKRVATAGSRPTRASQSATIGRRACARVTRPCAIGPSRDGVADAHARVERGEGVLEHRLDARRGLAAGRAHRRARRAMRDLAAGRRQDAGEDAAERGFAAAGFADQAQRLAAARSSSETSVDGLHGAASRPAAPKRGGDAVAER